jgi:hypothetical protein
MQSYVGSAKGDLCSKCLGRREAMALAVIPSST